MTNICIEEDVNALYWELGLTLKDSWDCHPKG